MPPLTDTQEKVLALLPIFPSLLSMACSLTIIYVVYQHYRDKRQTTVYHRLLVGMSLCDVVTSFWVPWFAFLVPADTSTRVWAIGNDGTCTFMAFIFNFAFSGLLYNGTLSCYFLLTARFGWRDTDIAKRCELWMHGVVVLFPLICGLVFVGLGVYGEQPIGLGCWVDDYPHGCGTDEGQAACITPLLGWISAGLPVLVSFASLLINNLLIYCYVRKTVAKAKRHAVLALTGAQESHSSGNFSSILHNASSILHSIHRPTRNHDSQTRRIQSVAGQAALYVLVFFLNYIWTMILRIVGAGEKYWTDEHESDLLYLLVLQAIFMPLQGFFNLCVFSRPKYMRICKNYPSHSRFWVFRRAMFGDAVKLPKPRTTTLRPMRGAPENSTATISSTTARPVPQHEKELGKKNDTSNDAKVSFSERVNPMEVSSPEATAGNPHSIPDLRASRRGSMWLFDLLDSKKSNDDKIKNQDFSLPLNENNDRPLRQIEFDSFLFEFDDFSDFERVADENEGKDEDKNSPSGTEQLGEAIPEEVQEKENDGESPEGGQD